MRVLWKHVVAALAASLLVALPATAQDLSGSIAVESKRQFAEQGMTLKPEDPAFVSSLTATWKINDTVNVYANAWDAYTEEEINHETDGTIGANAKVGGCYSVDGSLAIFVMEESKEAYRGRLTVACQVTDDFSVAVNGDVVRGGFETEVLRAQVFYNPKLNETFTGNLRAGISVDSWSGDTVGQWGIGVSAPVNQVLPFLPLPDNVIGSIAWSGYAVLEKGYANKPGDDRDDMFGATIAFGL